MTIRERMLQWEDLSAKDLVDIAFKSYMDVYQYIKERHLDFFHVVYGNEDGYIAFLIDLLKVSIAADGVLTENEVILTQMILKHISDTDYSENDVYSLFKSVDRDSYKLVSNIGKGINDDQVVGAMAAFLASVAAIDGRVSEEEISFVESLC